MFVDGVRREVAAQAVGLVARVEEAVPRVDQVERVLAHVRLRRHLSSICVRHTRVTGQWT